MTAPALPGAAPDPAPGRNDPARLPPEVERAIGQFAYAVRREAQEPGEPSTTYATEQAAALRTAIARALGGDGEPVAWAVFKGDSYEWVHDDEAKARENERDGYRVVPLYTRPAATGDTGEVEKAARTAALYVDEAWRKGAPKSAWHPIKATLMRDAIRAATGG